MAVSSTDVDDPSNYAEFRGVIERIEDDGGLAFVKTVAERYGLSVCNPGDSRVVFFVKVHHVVGFNLQPPADSRAEAKCAETNEG